MIDRFTLCCHGNGPQLKYVRWSRRWAMDKYKEVCSYATMAEEDPLACWKREKLAVISSVFST